MITADTPAALLGSCSRRGRKPRNTSAAKQKVNTMKGASARPMMIVTGLAYQTSGVAAMSARILRPTEGLGQLAAKKGKAYVFVGA